MARCSNREYQELTGRAKAARRHKRDLARLPHVRAFQDKLPSLRTADLAQAVAHVEAFAAGHVEATRLYCSRRQREERFEVRRRTQKTLDALCRRAAGKEGKTDVRPVVVAFGDAGFSHASRGHASGPTKGFKRQLARHCHAVIDTSEFRSSARCSACGSALSDRHGGARLRWGVRRCDNNECSSSWWNRDVNAARNIGRAFLLSQLGVPLPAAFRRGGGVLAEEEEETETHVGAAVFVDPTLFPPSMTVA